MSTPRTELWYTRCPVPTASGVAIATGALDDEFAADGIAVRSLSSSDDARTRESHFDHNRADSFRQGGNIPPLWTAARGGDLRLIGLSWVESAQQVVTLADSDVVTPADLAGRRIGLARRVNDRIDFWRATALAGVEAALRADGLDLDAVTVVDLPEPRTYIPDTGGAVTGSLFGAFVNRRLQATEVTALLRGEVDAIFVSGLRAVDLAASFDVRVVADVGALPQRDQRVCNIAPVALTVSGRLLDERPDLVTRYLATLQRAAGWAADHPDETRRVMAREIGFAEEFVDHAYGADLHRRLAVGLDDDLVDALVVQKDFLLRHGFLDGDVDVAAWIDPTPLRAAADLLAAA